MITDKHKQAITQSWRLVVPIRDTVPDLFYRRLFELAPSYRALFSNDMAAQKRKLISMLSFIVKSLEWPDSAWEAEVDDEEDLFLIVLALGRRHSELYKIPDASYAVVGEALVWTLDFALGEAFDDACQEAWLHVYDLISRTMRMSSMATSLGAPVVDPGEAVL